MPLFARESLPPDLWRGGRLHLPRTLNRMYASRLEALGVLEVARLGSERREIFGGPGLAETHEHFAQRFPNSLARVLCLLLDPDGRFAAIPRDLFLTLASHHLALLDIPCGSGAGGIALLGLLAELRVSGRLPMLPLTVSIFGADVSPHALANYLDKD